jgi:Transcriptional regulators containing a DNA-binding HTH domain and an aminotransferase domain (MocR family) and their eukaryotic orthologs
VPIYSQLYEYIKYEILNKNILAGEKLPSIRHLSKYLNISKNTVVTAYEQLIAEGYVVSKGRSGIYVEELNNEIINKKNQIKVKNNLGQSDKEPADIKYDLRNAQIDVHNFPFALWKKVINQSVSYDNSELINYGEHQGEEELRIQISRYLFLSRGVKCHPQQILIGAGTQQSLSMLCMILKEIGSEIAFEEPGYNGARQVFINNGYEISPIELDNDGINIGKLKNSKAKIAYITPSHQFPYGMVMPVSKRLMLLNWAFERKGYIIEDDYDGEFRYQGKPIPSLQGLDENGNVIYIGTFSKSLIPSIRISYMVLPEKLLNIYKNKYYIYEQPVARHNQKAMCLFMEKGHWDRHVKKMRNIYKKKHEQLLGSINDIFGDSVEIIGKDAGLHILIKVKNHMTEGELIESALNNNIAVSSTSQYWMDREKIKTPIIFIGFGGIKLEEIPESIKILKHSWFR